MLETSPVAEQDTVALGRGLCQRVLRLGELEVGFGAADGRLCFVEAQSGVDALQTDEHGALLDELPHVDRRGDDAAGGVRGDVGRFVGLEAAGGLERDGLLLRLDRRYRDVNRGGGLRRSVRCGASAARGRQNERGGQRRGGDAPASRHDRTSSVSVSMRSGESSGPVRRPASVNATPVSITSAVRTAGQGVLKRLRCRTW